MLAPLSSLTVLSSSIDWRYFLAGGAACSFSHGIAVPFDVIKTRIQLNENNETGGDFLGNFQTILQNEGLTAFSKGLGQTLTGYAVQGSLKYGLYEEFKPIVKHALETESGDSSRLFTFILAGAAAELIASSALTPFEALRIQAVSQPISLLSDRVGDKPKPVVISKKILGKDLFRALPALIAKQVPFTIVQLSSFELLTSFIYTTLQTQDIDTTSGYTKFSITFVSALVSGFFSAVASQPGDAVVSVTNKKRRTSESGKDTKAPSVTDIAAKIYEDGGMIAFFKGFEARLLHVAVIVVSQLLVYDTVKQAFGIAATGSH